MRSRSHSEPGSVPWTVLAKRANHNAAMLPGLEKRLDILLVLTGGSRDRNCEVDGNSPELQKKYLISRLRRADRSDIGEACRGRGRGRGSA